MPRFSQLIRYHFGTTIVLSGACYINIKNGLGFVQHTVPDQGLKTLFRDDIDRASEPVLKEVFHRDQIDQTKACVSNDLDEYVHIASGSGVTPGE